MRNKSQIHQLYYKTNAITASYLQLHLYKHEPATCNKIAKSKILKTVRLQTKQNPKKKLFQQLNLNLIITLPFTIFHSRRWFTDSSNLSKDAELRRRHTVLTCHTIGTNQMKKGKWSSCFHC